jgi:pyruvate dehydrogenase E2 component (dihydrolipoamide acetyltransferase)
MISEIIIPDLGSTGGDVILEEWLVEVGELVKAGQAIFVVTTDKATVEVEAFRDGVLREALVKAGQTLATGTVVALLADSLEEQVHKPETTKEAQINAAHSHVDLTVQTKPKPDEARILASPLARRMAAEQGIALESLKGSGSNEQILKRDVLSAIAARQASSEPIPPGAQRVALTPMRRAIAERVQRSNSEIPHFNASITVDMTAALEARRQAVEWAEKHGFAKPSITDLCIKATALTLTEFPTLNASFEGETILIYEEINIGLVIGLEEGMLVPVIRGADRMNLFALAATSHKLKQQAEGGRLSANDLSGGTFTLSNLGMYGLDSFTAVINPPQAGILALGAVKEQSAVVDGALSVRPLMTATLSVDHRIVDGITAARFVDSFKETLENPLRLVFDPPQESKP